MGVGERREACRRGTKYERGGRRGNSYQRRGETTRGLGGYERRWRGRERLMWGGVETREGR